MDIVSRKTRPDEPFDLSRFLSAQDQVYADVLAELKSGQKRTHWMWFVFPQIDGLGFSATTQYYAIKSLEEARQYLAHPVLGKRLRECAEAVLAVQGRNISEIFSYPDDLKLKSCLTLFAAITDQQDVFAKVLDQYYHGERDARTVQILVSLQK